MLGLSMYWQGRQAVEETDAGPLIATPHSSLTMYQRVGPTRLLKLSSANVVLPG